MNNNILEPISPQGIYNPLQSKIPKLIKEYKLVKAKISKLSANRRLNVVNTVEYLRDNGRLSESQLKELEN